MGGRDPRVSGQQNGKGGILNPLTLSEHHPAATLTCHVCKNVNEAGCVCRVASWSCPNCLPHSLNELLCLPAQFANEADCIQVGGQAELLWLSTLFFKWGEGWRSHSSHLPAPFGNKAGCRLSGGWSCSSLNGGGLAEPFQLPACPVWEERELLASFRQADGAAVAPPLPSPHEWEWWRK